MWNLFKSGVLRTEVHRAVMAYRPVFPGVCIGNCRKTKSRSKCHVYDGQQINPQGDIVSRANFCFIPDTICIPGKFWAKISVAHSLQHSVKTHRKLLKVSTEDSSWTTQTKTSTLTFLIPVWNESQVTSLSNLSPRFSLITCKAVQDRGWDDIWLHSISGFLLIIISLNTIDGSYTIF